MSKGSNLREELAAVSSEAAARNVENARKAAEHRKQQHDIDVSSAAQGFLRDRTEHLEDILRDRAKKGETSHVVWTHNLSRPIGIRDEGVWLGMQRVGEWLNKRGFDIDLVDSGGEDVFDYGYVHTYTLTARWGSR